MRRMNSFGRQGLVAAMENEAVAADETNQEAALGEHAESLETDLIEVQEEEVAAADQDAAVEEAVETAEALESIAVAMESAAANGGLSKDAAAVVSIALEHMYASVGISSNKSMPALESFGQTSSRVGATQLALEDIKQKIADIWKAIVEAVKKSIAWVTERLTKIFGAANKLEKRAKALASRAGSVTGTAKEKTFESERLVAALNIGGAVAADSKAAEIVKLYATNIGDSDAKEGEAIAKAFEDGNLAEIVKTYSSGAAAISTNLKEVSGADAANFQIGEGMKLLRGPELPGGKALLVRISGASGPQSDEQAAASLSKLGGYIGAFNPKATTPSKKEVPTLSGSDAEAIAELVADAALAIQGYKKGLKKATEIKNKIASAMDKLAKETPADDAAKAKAKALQKIGSAVPRLIDQPAADISLYVINTGKALCDYVELSLKQYEGK